jgi:regulator of CtrA degradation
MQLASWLLLQRAVNEGEMTLDQASKEKHKVRLSRQDIATSREGFERLPAELRELALQSLRLQERIIHLDQLIYSGEGTVPAFAPDAAPTSDLSIGAQFQLLRAAFPGSAS